MNRPLLSASLSHKLEKEFYQRQSFSRKASSSEANGQHNANDANGNRPSDEFEQVAAEVNGVHDKGGNEKAVTATSAWSSASRDVASHRNEKRSHSAFIRSLTAYIKLTLWFLPCSLSLQRNGSQDLHLDFALVPHHYSSHFLGCWILLHET